MNSIKVVRDKERIWNCYNLEKTELSPITITTSMESGLGSQTGKEC